MTNQSFDLLAGAFLGRQLENLSSIIAEQCKPVFDKYGVTVPVKSCSALLLIQSLNGASVADIAKRSSSSHQLINQKITTLMKLDLIECENDSNDKRRKIYRLTKSGGAQCERIDSVLPIFVKAYEDLYKELDCDLLKISKKAEDILLSKPLIHRIE